MFYQICTKHTRTLYTVKKVKVNTKRWQLIRFPDYFGVRIVRVSKCNFCRLLIHVTFANSLDIMSALMCILTIWHYAGFPESSLWKRKLWKPKQTKKTLIKNCRRQKACKVTQHANILEMNSIFGMFMESWILRVSWKVSEFYYKYVKYKNIFDLGIQTVLYLRYNRFNGFFGV